MNHMKGINGWTPEQAKAASEDETVKADTTDQQAKRFKLWFFRDVPEDIRLKLFGLMMYGIAARELETHAAQRSALDFCLSSLGTGFSLQDELKRVNALLTARTTEAASAAAEPPIDAGDAFRKTLIDRADGRDERGAPLWYGWAIMDAFLAGAAYARPTPNPPPALPASVDDYNTALEEVKRLREALQPFAGYLDTAKFDLDNNGAPLPDDQGMGWVYLTVGDFRRARSALTQ